MRASIVVALYGIAAGVHSCEAFAAAPSSARSAARLGGRERGDVRDARLSASTNGDAGDEEEAEEALVAEDRSAMTVVKLKDRLRELHLPVGGRKRELIARLDDHYSRRRSINIGTEEEETTPSIEFRYWTGRALKECLRELGLPSEGRKAELIERLNATMVGVEESEKRTTSNVPFAERRTHGDCALSHMDEILDDVLQEARELGEASGERRGTGS